MPEKNLVEIRQKLVIAAVFLILAKIEVGAEFTSHIFRVLCYVMAAGWAIVYLIERMRHA